MEWVELYEALPDNVRSDLSWWIDEYVRPASDVNWQHSSYGLKHLFHSQTGTYVTNDEFKSAMYAHGYEPSDESEENWRFKILNVRFPGPHQPEAALEKRFSLMVSRKGGKALKFTPPGWTGAPDRLVLLPGGVSVFVEFKVYGEHPRPLQEQRHKELRALGFPVWVISLDAECEAFIETYFGELGETNDL